MKDKNVRLELDRVKRRLFGYGNEGCLNLMRYEGGVLGRFEHIIVSLRNELNELQDSVAELRKKKVVRKKRK